ncbi:MAG: ribulose-phosphate 3-epimerase [Chloroflexi bacterium]|nr:ribulose-phosphate 3-epimerase [Chloroflexota bacterium]
MQTKREFWSGLQGVHISASILAADWSNLGQAVKEAEKAGVDSIHIDIMDGHYVHNLTLGIKTLSCLRPHTKLPFVAHLEISNPDDFVADFAEAGSDMLIVQEDTCPDLAATIQRIKDYKVAVGVALNPDRPLSAVIHVLHQIDLLLIMSVFPGFGGQKFLAEVLPKVEEARRRIRDLANPPAIGLDGGINPQTIQASVRAGANFLAIGSAIYGEGSVRDNVRKLRDLTILVS